MPSALALKLVRFPIVACFWIVAALFTLVDAAGQQDARTETAMATSRIWLEPIRTGDSEGQWYSSAVQVVAGDVIDFDADQLRFVPAGATAETLVSALRVLWIEPSDRESVEQQAIDHYRDGSYSECLSKLPEILRQRPAVWRQQWITMLAANAAWKSGRAKIALELVGQLDRRPLPPMIVAWLPIAWSGGMQPNDAVVQAKSRLADPSPAVQLVAASWLLSSPDRREAAAVLSKLATNARIEIATFAQSLLWRIAPPPQVIESARDWEQRVNQMPMVLQTGPTTTLIDKLRAAGKSDDADRLQWSIDLTPIHPRP